MRNVLFPILLIAVVVAIPIVPFLAFGPAMEARIEGWIDRSATPATVAGVVVGLLATDVLLPIPSSILSTFAGNRLGLLGGTAVSWLGMTLGAALAYLLARCFGRPVAVWLSSEEALGQSAVLSRRFGPMVLVLARPVPVLAEASVLYLGTTGLSWRRFLLPIGLSNLGIAAVYSILGDTVQLPIALAASITLPIAAAMIARFCWPLPTTSDD